ncbi:MAG TPA: FAD-dependent oxidoreductase [Candidatus Coprenecus pullistercoris]|nr:FAD-dependent oxidoreductase [Candidatus Coprenecus pullistercoris]
MEPDNHKKNIVVIGGGPAGIEASRTLDAMGHTVFLIEKADRLGGHLARWDRLFPYGTQASEVLSGMTSSMGSVKWFTGTQITQLNRLEHGYNIILSNGLTVLADALLITTGFSLFPASKKEEYGYGIYDRVITNADLEDWFSGISVPAIDNPHRIGFVHCVGSRDEKVGNRYCSKVCCATAVKQACEIKQKFPDAVVYCFYMDLRMFGRGYEDMYLEAQKKYGVIFVRGRVSEVSEDKNGHLFVKAEDTLAGKPLRVTLDLLVLMAGMSHNRDTDSIARTLALSTMEDGFLKPKDSLTDGQASYCPGVFYAGACTGPKTIPETVAEAKAAAISINEYLRDND